MGLFFLLRRSVTILLCAGSFWLGVKTDGMIKHGSGGNTAGVSDCNEVKNGQ